LARVPRGHDLIDDFIFDSIESERATRTITRTRERKCSASGRGARDDRVTARAEERPGSGSRSGAREDALLAVLEDVHANGELSRLYGIDRSPRPGQPVDRVFIERFVERETTGVHGRILEVGDARYTNRFIGARATAIDIVDDRTDDRPDAEPATIVGDLCDPATLPPSQFDCILLIQVLLLVDDPAAAIRNCARALRPGGVLLASAPGIIRTEPEIASYRAMDRWRWTRRGFESLFETSLRDIPSRLRVESFGTLATAVAFLLGFSARELPAHFFDASQSDFPVSLCARVELLGS
jgi:SAM-dependent methyltransferase